MPGAGEASPAPDGSASRSPASAEQFLDAFDSFVQAVRRARGASAHERGRSLTLSQYGLLQPLADTDQAARQVIDDLVEKYLLGTVIQARVSPKPASAAPSHR